MKRIFLIEKGSNIFLINKKNKFDISKKFKNFKMKNNNKLFKFNTYYNENIFPLMIKFFKNKYNKNINVKYLTFYYILKFYY